MYIYNCNDCKCEIYSEIDCFTEYCPECNGYLSCNKFDSNYFIITYTLKKEKINSFNKDKETEKKIKELVSNSEEFEFQPSIGNESCQYESYVNVKDIKKTFPEYFKESDK